MTLGAIVIPLRLKQKIFPPGQACIVFPRDWFLCFMGDESVDTLRSLGDTGNLSLARRQGCQHSSQRSELMWKPARKPMSGGSSWEHSLCFRRGQKRAEVGWGSRWTPRPHVSLTTVFSDYRGLNGLSHHVAELEQVLRPLRFPQQSMHIISSDMCHATKWPASRKYEHGHERSGRRNTCSHRDMGLQAIDPHSPICKRAS